ncbi:MAG: hypothetical protein V3R11_00415 [Nitrospirales bacterium]
MFSRRLEARRTEQGNTTSPPRLLRPRWTAFLTILLAVLMPSLIS